MEAASTTRPSRVRAALAPHAPYSVSPALLRALANHRPDRPISIHLAESAAEMEFLRNGSGAWREVLERVGAWNPSWQIPGCGPVEYLAGCGLLSARTLVVHGVPTRLGRDRAIASAGATIVTCPRSNEWVGAGRRRCRVLCVRRAVAIGTDSLASSASLSVFDEWLAEASCAGSRPRPVSASATRVGAERSASVGWWDARLRPANGPRSSRDACQRASGDVEETSSAASRTTRSAWASRASDRVDREVGSFTQSP